MARQANYEQRIEALKGKIETKQEQLKALKKQLADLESAQAQSKMQDIASLIESKGLNPADVLAVLNERFQ